MLCRNHRPFQVRSTGLLNLNLFNTVNTNSACCLPIHCHTPGAPGRMRVACKVKKTYALGVAASVWWKMLERWRTVGA